MPLAYVRKQNSVRSMMRRATKHFNTTRYNNATQDGSRVQLDKRERCSAYAIIRKFASYWLHVRRGRLTESDKSEAAVSTSPKYIRRKVKQV